MTRILTVLALALAVAAPISPAAAKEPKTRQVNCDKKNPKLIADVIDKADDGDTILIIGSCTETLLVEKSITLDGQGTGSISPESPTDVTITVTNAAVTVAGLSLESPARTQVGVGIRGAVTVDGSTLRNATATGLAAISGSFAIAINSTISDNGRGVLIADGATGRIGLLGLTDVVPSPNVISGNTGEGVVVTGNGSAEVIGNTISSNDIAVAVTQGGRARVAANTISTNRLGIVLTTNASVALADPAVADNPIFAIPNDGAAPPQLAIICQGGSIFGRIGGFLPALRVQPPAGALAGIPGPTPPFTFCRDVTVP